MTLFIRLLWMGWKSRSQPKFNELTDISRTCFRVWPTDLDALRHMNNARYFSYMEIARFNIVVRTGLLTLAKKQGVFVLVASETIQFRRPLKLFQKFEILSRVAFFTDRWIYLEQKFVSRGETVAIGWVRIAPRDHRGTLSPYQLAELLQYPPLQKEIPPAVSHWVAMDKEMFESAKRLT